MLIEIGGNDMFWRTDVASYEENLDELLQRVKGPGGAVAFERSFTERSGLVREGHRSWPMLTCRAAFLDPHFAGVYAART